MKVIEREEVDLENTWNVSAMFGSWDEWNQEFESFQQSGKEGKKFPHLSKENVEFTQASSVKKFLDAYMKTDQKLGFLYTYAHLRHDENVAEEKGKSAFSSATGLLHAFQEETSWFDPALLQLSSLEQEELLKASELQQYRIYLCKILRLKPYTLSCEQERLMAFAARALETGHRAFSALDNADIKFPPCEDSEGKKKELTPGLYQVYMRGQDRTLRKNAFTQLLTTYHGYENTLCELLQGEIQQHNFVKKARGYASCLEASLYPREVDPAVYSSLITTVHKNLDSLHDYIDLRKQLLGYSELHFYDLAVPVIPDVSWNISYEEGVSLVLESVSCLGKEYQDTLRKGLTADRWVDRYENKKKRNGAYSSGCYGSFPYILLNYHDMLQDTMTLTHEAGHSMHSYLSRKHQPYQDHHYPIFLAEVASTFHEELLFEHLLEKAKTKEQKAFLINQKIDDIRATFFRQTLFAEFERQVHLWVENDVPLTPALLNKEYHRLTEIYFGPSLTIDPEVSYEWSRIPHFYYNFYVYQYATGISAAQVLAKKVLQEEPLAKEKYLEFLSSGGSLGPLQTLEKAGVDMRAPQAVENLLVSFQKLVRELRKLLT